MNRSNRNSVSFYSINSSRYCIFSTKSELLPKSKVKHTINKTTCIPICNMWAKCSQKKKKKNLWMSYVIILSPYMMLLAITALLSFPLVISHKFNKSRMTITKNLFSWKIPKMKRINIQKFRYNIKKLCN